MPATRSHTKKADLVEGAEDTSKVDKKLTASASSKRQAKKAKEPANTADKTGDEGVILINRAPVLQLWAACVASFLYEDIPWSTCLSVGAAISTLCAISKGRAIGAIEKPSPAEVDRKRQERREKAKNKQLDELEVMGFDLAIEKGNALVSGKPKKVSEAALSQKYGESSYAEVRTTFEASLKTWLIDAESLNAQAFHMYESFRPSIPPGQRGWGRKGQLNLDTVKSVVSKT